jgi:uncharacterized cupin superfamily protein
LSTVRTSSASATDYQPFETPNGAEGEVHWIRESGTDGVDLRTGIWRCAPGQIPDAMPVTFAGAETLYLIEGDLHIDLVEQGRTLKLCPGDIASFERGTPTLWTVKTPVKALMVIADAADGEGRDQ